MIMLHLSKKANHHGTRRFKSDLVEQYGALKSDHAVGIGILSVLSYSECVSYEKNESARQATIEELRGSPGRAPGEPRGSPGEPRGSPGGAEGARADLRAILLSNLEP